MPPRPVNLDPNMCQEHFDQLREPIIPVLDDGLVAILRTEM